MPTKVVVYGLCCTFSIRSPNCHTRMTDKTFELLSLCIWKRSMAWSGGGVVAHKQNIQPVKLPDSIACRCERSSRLIRNLSNCEREAWKKFRLQRDSNPWPLRYQCSALPTELWSHNCWEQVNFSGSINNMLIENWGFIAATFYVLHSDHAGANVQYSSHLYCSQFLIQDAVGTSAAFLSHNAQIQLSCFLYLEFFLFTINTSKSTARKLILC